MGSRKIPRDLTKMEMALSLGYLYLGPWLWAAAVVVMLRYWCWHWVPTLIIAAFVLVRSYIIIRRRLIRL